MAHTPTWKHPAFTCHPLHTLITIGVVLHPMALTSNHNGWLLYITISFALLLATGYTLRNTNPHTCAEPDCTTPDTRRDLLHPDTHWHTPTTSPAVRDATVLIDITTAVFLTATVANDLTAKPQPTPTNALTHLLAYTVLLALWTYTHHTTRHRDLALTMIERIDTAHTEATKTQEALCQTPEPTTPTPNSNEKQPTPNASPTSTSSSNGSTPKEQESSAPPTPKAE